MPPSLCIVVPYGACSTYINRLIKMNCHFVCNRGFTPALVKSYETIVKDGKNFEVIFCSGDHDEKSYKVSQRRALTDCPTSVCISAIFYLSSALQKENFYRTISMRCHGKHYHSKILAKRNYLRWVKHNSRIIACNCTSLPAKPTLHKLPARFGHMVLFWRLCE